MPRGWMGAVAGRVRHGRKSYEGPISSRGAGAYGAAGTRYDDRTRKEQITTYLVFVLRAKGSLRSKTSTLILELQLYIYFSKLEFQLFSSHTVHP